jgi:hypothetical protein
MWHAWERRENCTRFWWESPKERDHSEDQGVGGRIGSETGVGVWIGFDWLRIWTQFHTKLHECVVYSQWVIFEHREDKYSQIQLKSNDLTR